MRQRTVVRVVEAAVGFVALWLFDALGTPWRAKHAHDRKKRQ